MYIPYGLNFFMKEAEWRYECAVNDSAVFMTVDYWKLGNKNKQLIRYVFPL